MVSVVVILVAVVLPVITKDPEYQKQLEEAKLDDATVNSNNQKRFLKALKALEVAGKDNHCAFCGARTYRDSCVVIRPGFWAAPRSFHNSDCLLNKVMNEAHDEIVIEEEAKEKIWHRTEGRRIAIECQKRTSAILKEMKAKRK